jgi:hypothetical protein
MPPGAVYVGRPTKWGNPFRPEAIGRELALALYRGLFTGWSPDALKGWTDEGERQAVYRLHQQWIERLDAAVSPIDFASYTLRGLDLACWCPLVDSAGRRVPCHADIVLEYANS